MDPVPPFFVDWLFHFYRVWSCITSDRWVLHTIALGYTCQFCCNPYFPLSLPIPLQGCFSQAASSPRGAVAPKGRSSGGGSTPELRCCGFYSRYFLIPKANSSLRLIVDLRNLTKKFMKKLKIHMVCLASIIPFLDPGNWCTVLDIKDAYFYVAMFQGHRRFLLFVVNHVHYQFTVLPFGARGPLGHS